MIYGDYTIYILGAYGIAGILLGGLCLVSVLRHRRLRKTIARDI
jgi:heme exporter protein CcmD